VTGAYLTAPGLLVQVFLRTGDQDAGTGWQRLRSLWGDVTGQLGFDRPVPSLAAPWPLPADPVAAQAGPGLLAAAERAGASVWQAFAWADRGILGLTAMMAPPRDRDCPGAWTDLEQAWEEAVAGRARDGVLGEARIFLALLVRPPGARPPSGSPGRHDPAGASALGASAPGLVAAAAPGPSNAGWWRHWDTVPLGSPGGAPGEILVWEIGPGTGDARGRRRLAAVAPAEAERQADKFLWTTGDGTHTPLARHLMHAARLRYQIGVFGDGERSRQLRDELDLVAGRLADEPDPAADLTRLRRAHGAAITLRARLDAMRHAVGLIEENLRMALNLPAGAAVTGPLTEDRELARWFGRRLDQEITRLDAAAGHAESARGLLAGERLRPASPPGFARRPRAAGGPEPWAVVFTALGVEYEAIRYYLGDPVGEHEERGTLYEIGTLPGARGSWRVALAQTGPGSTTAALALERAVPVFAPEVALFLGVAGGRKDVARGDVVVAETIYDYEQGKSTQAGYEPRIRTHRPAHRLLQRAQLVAREDRWQRRIPPGGPGGRPAAFVKPIVTGGKVIAHGQSQIARLLDRYASDALAVETEGHGFLAGAYLNREVEALVIRGISDLLAGKDRASDEYWQPVASRHAAAFAVELLDGLGARRAQPA
jgi:nucleoside phosphorylase